MRIAFLGNGRELLQPRAGNSLAVQTIGLAQALRERHELHVLSRSDRSHGFVSWRFRGAEKAIDGVRYHFLPSDAEPRQQSTPASWSAHDARHAAKFLRRALAKLRAIAPDAVVVWEAGAFVEALRAELPRARLFLHDAHGSLVLEDDARARAIATAADRILVPSQVALGAIAERHPAVAPRLAHLPFGVDTDLFRALVPKGKLSKRFDLIRGESTMLTFVGRLTPEKGAHVVLDLYERCKARIAREPHVFLIGPAALDPSHPRRSDPFAAEKNGYAARLQERARALGATIHLLPDAPPPVVAGHLEAADVFLYPALGDQVSGGVLGEAIASGVGVIGYQGGVLTEVVGRSADLGTLAPRGDLDALAAALLGYLERPPDERFERGQRARQLAITELTFATIAGKLERWLESG